MPNNERMHNANSLIDGLGGTAQVARKLGIASPSVSEWRKRGFIPQDKLVLLAPGAEAIGLAKRVELLPLSVCYLVWPELAETQTQEVTNA